MRARNEKQQQWPVVGGGPEGMRYSPLDQINRSNVQTLQQAMAFRFRRRIRRLGITVQSAHRRRCALRRYTATPHHRARCRDRKTALGFRRQARRDGQRKTTQPRTRRIGPRATIAACSSGSDTGCTRLTRARDSRRRISVRRGRIDLREGLGQGSGRAHRSGKQSRGNLSRHADPRHAHVGRSPFSPGIYSSFRCPDR